MGKNTKFIVSAIMGFLIIIDQLTGFSFPFIDEEWLTILLAVIGPILVWALPNRERL